MILRNILILLLILLDIKVKAQQNWTKSFEKNNIKVYTRKSDNNSANEVLIITNVNASLSAIVSLIKDVKNHPNWVYANTSAKILKKYNNFEWLYYGISDLPWPIKDRDVVSLIEMKQYRDLSIKIASKAYPSLSPKNEGMVRIRYINSYWSLRPITKENTLVKLKIAVDMGGALPAWLVNLAIENGPYQTLNNFRNQLKKDIYKKSHLKYIHEMVDDPNVCEHTEK